MKFFAPLAIFALSASAAPASYSQVHHTIGLGHQQTHHKQIQLVAEPTKVETVAYAQPTHTYIQKPAAQYIAPATNYQTQYIAAAPAVHTQYVHAPAVQTKYVHAPAVQTQYIAAAPAVQTMHKALHHEIATLPVHQVDRTVQYLDTPHIEKPATPQVVRIEPTTNALHLHFDTRSSPLTTSQSHIPAPAAEPKYQEAQDETSYLKTDIKKAVVQNVIETVHPQREIKQVVAPLTETVNTVVSRATGPRAEYVAPAVEITKPMTFIKPAEFAVQGHAIEFNKPVEYVQSQTFQYTKPAEFAIQAQAVEYAKPMEVAVEAQAVEYAKPTVGFAYTAVQDQQYITKPIVEKQMLVQKPSGTIAY